MHIHIVGICGTFMGGIAALAKQMGHEVSGCDQHIYPPMSTQLEHLDIMLYDGFDTKQLLIKPDVWIIGNGISRGNPLLEALLEHNAFLQSGPQWLYENLLRFRHVIALSGTHGKTTTTAMVAFILQYMGRWAEDDEPTRIATINRPSEPGFLIGGVAKDFSSSAQLGSEQGMGKYFVIEADEYDTAFFDKRSKFLHYHPRTLVINNVEFDHADIFSDITAIETQFHHMVRTLPKQARIIANGQYPAIHRLIKRGLYSEIQWLFDDQSPSGWTIVEQGAPEQKTAYIRHNEEPETLHAIPSNIVGDHNRANALAAAAACYHLGFSVAQSMRALAAFQGVKRRMELKGSIGGVRVYDDFAHHPTAIAATLLAMRELLLQEHNKAAQDLPYSKRLLAVVEPRSNTMKMGVFAHELPESLMKADLVFAYQKDLGWDVAAALKPLSDKKPKSVFVEHTLDALIHAVTSHCREGDVVLVMSNGGFEGFHDKLLLALGEGLHLKSPLTK